MQTDTLGRSRAARFAALGVATSLGAFGLLRLGWTESHVLLPITRLQAGWAGPLFGVPAAPIEVTLACSGADALALCLGAVLAYPAAWRARLAGAAGGAAMILVLNTLRIGTLGQVAASPGWFAALHLYVWPGVLTLAIAGYVLVWMRHVDRWPTRGVDASDHGGVTPVAGLRPSRRFIVLTVALLLLFTAAGPMYLDSPAVRALAGVIAATAAAVLTFGGMTAHATANVLYTPHGGFLVTEECVSTPLIPVYLAAVLAYSPTWRRTAVGMLATLPLFVALGIARLLVVALPAASGSPAFFVHAFFQILLAAVLVFVAAHWRHGRRAAIGRGVLGISAGVLFMVVLGPVYTQVIAAPVGVPLPDAQGALAFLPAFQVGFFIALWVAAFVGMGWPPFLVSLAALGLTQATGFVALHGLSRMAGVTADVRDVRGWAIAGPIMILAMVVAVARRRR